MNFTLINVLPMYIPEQFNSNLLKLILLNYILQKKCHKVRSLGRELKIFKSRVTFLQIEM